MNKRLLAGLLAVSTVMTTIAFNAPSSYANNSVDDGIRYCANNCDDAVEGLNQLFHHGIEKINDAVQWFLQHGEDLIEGGQKLDDGRGWGQDKYEEYQRGREERRENRQ